MFAPRLFWAGPWDAVGPNVDRIFSEVFGHKTGTPTFPAINVWEDAEAYRLEAEVPGMKLEDLEILILNNEVTLKGERKLELEQNSKVHRNERAMGPFNRVLRVPVKLNADEAKAELHNGVLRLYLPKAKEHQPRKIAVSTRAQG